MCRKYLQVTTLADITTASGKNLCPWALSENKDSNCPSINNWINQGPIKRKYWKMWERCLKETFCTKIKKKPTNTLSQQLGEWSELDRHQNWRIHLIPRTRQLLWRKGDGHQEYWLKYDPSVMKHKLIFNKTPGKRVNPQYKAKRISLTSESKNSWIFYGTSTREVTTEEVGTRYKTNIKEICE